MESSRALEIIIHHPKSLELSASRLKVTQTHVREAEFLLPSVSYAKNQPMIITDEVHSAADVVRERFDAVAILVVPVLTARMPAMINASS